MTNHDKSSRTAAVAWRQQALFLQGWHSETVGSGLGTSSRDGNLRCWTKDGPKRMGIPTNIYKHNVDILSWMWIYIIWFNLNAVKVRGENVIIQAPETHHEMWALAQVLANSRVGPCDSDGSPVQLVHNGTHLLDRGWKWMEEGPNFHLGAMPSFGFWPTNISPWECC